MLSWITLLQVALEGLAGSLRSFDTAPLYLYYCFLVGVEAETGFTTKSCTPTTVDVIGQVLG